ncbi:MAG: gamma carbonic anhydrase family protein [Ignavibacteriales bacterium]|jgi:carbonic anhydrase/acetyltransferase-like protein (isoleucine patch superfamily)|nr:gamma carbonic anhydrase family protein [Melioribacteraceae bacterium]RJP58152.1 MAG: gamma carbonic anhydrase family protein [Ignavibacteriales bacterium]
MKLYELDNENKLFPYVNTFPNLHDSVFLASGSKIIGDVEIKENSSVWYNTVIRGDVHYIKIGSGTNVQDNSMLHVTNGRYPLQIGDNVTIGHSVTLHGCTLKDLCLIGMGAIVLDGAVIESNSMVAAGTVVKPGFIVPSGKLVAGVPGKVIRDLTEKEILDFGASANRYIEYTKITVDSLIKYNTKNEN